MADERDPEGEPGGQEPSGQTDWKAEARKWQKRAQENFEKAKAYDDDQEKQKSELQKAHEEAASWKKQFDDLNAKAELVAKWGKPSSAPRTRKPGSFANDAGESKDAAKRELARRMFGSAN